MDYTLNIKGRLLSLETPQVMGILNVTPDSFYAGSRTQTEEAIAQRARQIVAEGGSIIDIGACSTRPGGNPVSEEEEGRRLRLALKTVRATVPDAIVSIDTYRPALAKMAIEEFDADIINDVSEGQYPEMLRLVAEKQVPYILMTQQANIHDMLLSFAEKVQQLRDLGQKDIILDPGFGFGKTMAGNYETLRDMEKLRIMELPILAGVSRKRMIHQLLGTTPADSLNGTTILNTIALLNGADILRVHDVRAAVEAVKIVRQTQHPEEYQEQLGLYK